MQKAQKSRSLTFAPTSARWTGGEQESGHPKDPTRHPSSFPRAFRCLMLPCLLRARDASLSPPLLSSPLLDRFRLPPALGSYIPAVKSRTSMIPAPLSSPVFRSQRSAEDRPRGHSRMAPRKPKGPQAIGRLHGTQGGTCRGEMPHGRGQAETHHQNLLQQPASDTHTSRHQEFQDVPTYTRRYQSIAHGVTGHDITWGTER